VKAEQNSEFGNPQFEIRNSAYPFTQTTCLISAMTFTRSFWFFITSSIDL